MPRRNCYWRMAGTRCFVLLFFKLMHLLQSMSFLVHISPAILDTVLLCFDCCSSQVRLLLTVLSAPLIKCWHKEGWYLAEPSLCFVLLLSRNKWYVHISHPTLKQSSRVCIILFIDNSQFSLFGFTCVVQIQNLMPFVVSFCIMYLHSVGNITE